MNYYIVETSSSFDEKIKQGIALSLKIAEERKENVSVVFLDYKNLDGYFSEALKTPINKLRKSHALMVNKTKFELISNKELSDSSLNSIVLCIFPNLRLLNKLEKMNREYEIIVPWISEDLKNIKTKSNCQII